MIKRIMIVTFVGCFLISCAPVAKAVLGTKKVEKAAEKIVNNESQGINKNKMTLSSSFEKYLESEKGEAYFKNINEKLGKLEHLEIDRLKGSLSDTMNYRMKAWFKESDVLQEVRVQTFNKREILDVVVIPWDDEMNSPKK